MSKPTTLAEAITWQAAHRRQPGESVRRYLNRRVSAFAEGLLDEAYLTPAQIEGICALIGEQALPLIFEQTDEATALCEPFNTHALADISQWYAHVDIDKLVGMSADFHEQRRADEAFRLAAVEGRLSVAGNVAAIKLQRSSTALAT